MKLTSKTLKKYIVEVIEEATRRELMFAGATAATMTALLSIPIKADMEKRARIKARIKELSKEDKEEFDRRKKQAHDDLNDLMITIPDPNVWAVAPTAMLGAFVPLENIMDYVDQHIELFGIIDRIPDFFRDWTVGSMYRYLFGSQNFWGTAQRQDSGDQRVYWRITTTTSDGKEVKVNKIPLAWTVVLDHWTSRFLLFKNAYEQAAEDQKEDLLRVNGIDSVQDYEIMKQTYENTISTFNDPRFIYGEHEDIY